MRLLLDENLSPRLVARLVSLFGDIKHVRDVGLQQANDKTIWGWAQANGRTVVTADSDFVTLSQRLGWPPKVVYLQQCSFPFRIIEEILRRNAVRISEFHRDDKTGVLSLKPGVG